MSLFQLVILACALLYFAGGLQFNINISNVWSFPFPCNSALKMKSVWVVLETMNSHEDFIIEYPVSYTTQFKDGFVN